jgi:hypothetical protein
MLINQSDEEFPRIDPLEVRKMVGKMYSTGLFSIRVIDVDSSNPRTHLRVMDLRSNVEYTVSAALVSKYKEVSSG